MLEQSIADEVEAAIRAGSAQKHLETFKRVTDLFLTSAHGCGEEQIELFGHVLERLIKTVELRALADVSAKVALAEISSQLASVKQAPPTVIRRLASNDEISVAGPVLTESARLSAEDLVELAQTKGEAHLLAISGRWWLAEVVTDALLARHYPSVNRKIVGNPGAKFSTHGFASVLAQAEHDPELAIETGIRIDLPADLRQRLLRDATEARLRCDGDPAAACSTRVRLWLTFLRDPARSMHGPLSTDTSGGRPGPGGGSRLFERCSVRRPPAARCRADGGRGRDHGSAASTQLRTLPSSATGSSA